MKIQLTGVFVDDQRKALSFYTETLGFQVKHDIPLGEHSWTTVVSPGDPEGPELLLEPAAHPAVGPYRDAMFEDGIPLASFAVEDAAAEHARLEGKGVRFVQLPTDVGTAVVATFDDTCGNLIQIMEVKEES